MTDATPRPIPEAEYLVLTPGLPNAAFVGEVEAVQRAANLAREGRTSRVYRLLATLSPVPGDDPLVSRVVP